MESINLIQWLGGIGGVGAVFGFLMYLALRETTKTMRNDRRYTEDRMTGILSDYNKATNENSKALTELIVLLRTLNGRLK